MYDQTRNERALDQPQGYGDGGPGADGEALAAIRTTRNYYRDFVTGFVLNAASDIEPAPTEWLRPGRIPLGHLTLLAGDPDAGKSLVTLDMAARVSTASAWPDGSAGQALLQAPGPAVP